MAINLQDYIKTKYKGVYKSKENYKIKGYKYLIRYKYQSKIYKKILGYSRKET